MSKANNALQRLGGNQFIAMTGAHSLADVGNGLQFRLPKRAANGANLVAVLVAGDTYDVRFYRLTGMILCHLATFELVPAERLVDLFTEQTGLKVRM